MKTTNRGLGAIVVRVVVPLVAFAALIYFGSQEWSSGAAAPTEPGAVSDVHTTHDAPGEPPVGEGQALADESSPAPPLDLPTGLELMRIWTVGDLPAKADRIVVTVDAAGEMEVDGTPCSISELPQRLTDRAQLRSADGGGSGIHCVVAPDRRARWERTALVLQAAARPGVMMRQIHFAVIHRGDGTMGQVAAFLPQDVGVTPRGPRTQRAALTARIRTSATATDPEAFLQPLKEWVLMQPAHGPFVIDASRVAPTERVLELIDVFHRAGAVGVAFAAQPPSAPSPPLNKADVIGQGGARAVPAATMGVQIPGLTPAKKPTAVVPVGRVEGEFAGFADSPDPLGTGNSAAPPPRRKPRGR